ncbi:hypothetical protein PCL_08839 [Purpureocillium lilacinum]|uniref:Uncharacterized protein n=1 Tax=Purpureocillium lilacinum TaxID=33203 RepID=A0A2U3EGF5_PURLI|nr:hypothetical protein PCL_08839 [Purpureocillium lilacinum]
MDLRKMEYQTERRSAAKVGGNDWAVTMTRGLRGWWLEQRVLEPTGEFPNGRKRDGNGGGGNCVRQDGSERGEARRRRRKRRCREGPGRLDGEEEAWPVSQPRMQVRAILQQNTGWMENRSGGGQGPASQPASQTMGGAMSDGTGARAIWPGTARRERESARRPSVHPLREAYTFPRRDTPEAHGAICSEALRSAQCVSRQWTKAVVLWRTSPVSVCMGGTADRRDDMRHWSPRWSPLEPTGDGWWAHRPPPAQAGPQHERPLETRWVPLSARRYGVQICSGWALEVADGRPGRMHLRHRDMRGRAHSGRHAGPQASHSAANICVRQIGFIDSGVIDFEGDPRRTMVWRHVACPD